MVEHRVAAASAPSVHVWMRGRGESHDESLARRACMGDRAGAGRTLSHHVDCAPVSHPWLKPCQWLRVCGDWRFQAGRLRLARRHFQQHEPPRARFKHQRPKKKKMFGFGPRAGKGGGFRLSAILHLLPRVLDQAGTRAGRETLCLYGFIHTAHLRSHLTPAAASCDTPISNLVLDVSNLSAPPQSPMPKTLPKTACFG